MDFTTRSSRQPQPAGNQGTVSSPVPEKHSNKKSGGRFDGKGLRVIGVVLLFCLTILVLAVIGLLVFGNSDESKYVNTKKYQAVFINGVTSTAGYVNGSIYFGHITKLNDKFMVLNDVYFLSDVSQNSSNSKSSTAPQQQLSKLGCQQLHAPYDQLIINRNDVAFWENIQDSGKVVQAIQQYQKQNPNGPNCTDSTNQTSANSTSDTNTSSGNSANTTSSSSANTNSSTKSSTTTP